MKRLIPFLLVTALSLKAATIAHYTFEGKSPPYDLTDFLPPCDTPGSTITGIVAPKGRSLDLLGG